MLHTPSLPQRTPAVTGTRRSCHVSQLLSKGIVLLSNLSNKINSDLVKGDDGIVRFVYMDLHVFFNFNFVLDQGNISHNFLAELGDFKSLFPIHNHWLEFSGP